MGAFFDSINIWCEDRERVLIAADAVFRKRRTRCLVSPSRGGWISLYPGGNGQDHRPAQELAKLLPFDILQLLVFDDDVFMFNYYRNHVEADCYTSWPGYFSENSLDYETGCVGQPSLFSHILGTKTTEFAKLLERDPENEKYTFESERLRKIAELFGIANADTSHAYLVDGKIQNIVDWEDFIEVPRRKSQGK
jgi:hypothetical protein